MKTTTRVLVSFSLLACAFLSLADAASAQTGPWTDGEILVRTVLPATGAAVIVRVVPETGATAILTTSQHWGGWAGSTTFDSFRGGVLSNMSRAPDNPSLFRLWLVNYDGTAAAMPGFTGSLRALASTGDGRVFFIRHGSAAQGPKTVEYFDASDVIHTLKQADGVTPFQIEAEHLLYDAPSNALIGSSSTWWSAAGCGPTGSSIYRIPLSGDGLRVNGPVTCTSVSTSLLMGEIMSLDHLPNGNVLAVTASGNSPPVNVLLSIHPVTLAVSLWADPFQGDINGGVWSARIGKAVIHGGNGQSSEPNGLRTFVNGQASFGGYLATSMPLLGGGGYSPDENMSEVDVNGPACDGFAIPYGAGLVGYSGFTPLLGAIGCPDIGNQFTLSINGVVGGTTGVLFAGLAPGAQPFMGGTFHISGPTLVVIPIPIGGAPGVANAGSLAVPLVIAQPILAGVNIYLQGAFVDVAATQGVSLTNGLWLQPG